MKGDMTLANAKVSAVATFGMLAMFYLGSVILQTISWGWYWTFEATRADTLAYSLALRLVGGLLSLVVFVLCLVGPRWGRIRISLAWILAVGVTIVVVGDNLSRQATTGVSQAGVWLIVGAIVSVHVFGVIAARRIGLGKPL
jgi:hypothetical protein